MWKKSVAVLSAIAGLAMAAPVPQDTVAAPATTKYIITLKPGIDPEIGISHINWAGDLHRRGVYRRQENGTVEEDLKVIKVADFNAYAGSFDEETIAELKASDEVSFVRVENEQINSDTYVRSPSSRKIFPSTCPLSLPRLAALGALAVSRSATTLPTPTTTIPLLVLVLTAMSLTLASTSTTRSSKVALLLARTLSVVLTLTMLATVLTLPVPSVVLLMVLPRRPTLSPSRSLVLPE
jgi:hypothetical protein